VSQRLLPNLRVSESRHRQPAKPVPATIDAAYLESGRIPGFGAPVLKTVLCRSVPPLTAFGRFCSPLPCLLSRRGIRDPGVILRYEP